MESKGVVVRYIDFLILLIPTTLVSALFCSIHSFFKCFSFFTMYTATVHAVAVNTGNMTNLHNY